MWAEDKVREDPGPSFWDHQYLGSQRRKIGKEGRERRTSGIEENLEGPAEGKREEENIVEKVQSVVAHGRSRGKL